MNGRRFKTWIPALVAAAIVLILFLMSQPPRLSDAKAKDLASRFRFQPSKLPVLSTAEPRKIRRVHSSLEHLAAWISFVGAAASVDDVDGDGLPNDIVYVDPRFDEIIVCPAPGTGDRYDAFELTQSQLEYNDESMAPMGTLIGDFNEDGRSDILVYFWGRSPIVYQQSGSDTDANTDANSVLSVQSFVPYELVEPFEVWDTSAVSQADLDGDGHVDLIIGNYNPDGAKTLDINDRGTTATMMGSFARAFNGGVDHLFLWSGAEHEPYFFKAAKGILDQQSARGWTFAVGAADLDNDLLPEIYFVHDFGPDCLLHNRSTPGKLSFVEVKGRRAMGTPRSGVVGMDTFNGMGVDFGDLNGDGRLDMMVSNITSDYGLHQTNFAFINSGDTEDFRSGVAPFRDHSERLGLARSGWNWECKLGDFDNDGLLEVMQATGFVKGKINRWPELHELALTNEELARFPIVYPKLDVDTEVAGHELNPFFAFNKKDGRYYNLAAQMTESGMDQPMLSRGIAMADVDGDGRLDYVLANHWEDSFFFRNTATGVGRFLGLHLRFPLNGGVGGNVEILAGHAATKETLPAIGAMVTVERSDGRKLVAQVDGGNGHSGQRSKDLHFGLGSAAGPLKVAVRWRGRDGKVHEHKTTALKPGWRTVLLGSTNDVEGE